MAYYAGVDLGATHVRAAVADEAGALLGVRRGETPQGPDGRAVTDAVLDALDGAAAAAGVDPGAVSAVGVGSIGPFDAETGAVLEPANLPADVARIPLVDPVREHVDAAAVHLHNDTDAGVLAERFYGDAPANAVYLTVSSGIGAGACVDGRVLDGWNRNAGEVGHLRVDPAGRRTCGCGGDGHWEAYCSGEHLPGYARDLHEREGVPTDLPLDDPTLDAAAVFDAAADGAASGAGDPLADRVLERAADWNLLGVTALVQAYAPEEIVLGGPVVVNNREQVVGPLEERLAAATFNDAPSLRVTDLGEEVVVRGAVASAVTGGTGTRSR